ncbi:MAG: STAS domain-containing protein [Gallionellaceae bacterium]
MNIADHNPFHINVSIAGDTATIYLVGRFSFKSHIEFKSVYKNQLANSRINRIVVDLADVVYIDSSALGMLLMLRDQAQTSNKSLTLSRPSSIAANSFNVANFSKLFNISE